MRNEADRSGEPAAGVGDEGWLRNAFVEWGQLLRGWVNRWHLEPLDVALEIVVLSPTFAVLAVWVALAFGCWPSDTPDPRLDQANRPLHHLEGEHR